METTPTKELKKRFGWKNCFFETNVQFHNGNFNYKALLEEFLKKRQ